MANAEYLLPRLQGFVFSFCNVNTFDSQARHFDRSFLSGLSQEDWRAVADSVQASLCNSVLTRALRQWPDSIYRLPGPLVLAKLKAHRDRLPTWAEQYYRFLARQVGVGGTDEDGYFEVLRQGEDRTRVTMYPLGPGGNPGPPHHQRTFLAAETQEVRLYGQGGADVFVLDGRNQRGPLVRVVGGAGRDTSQPVLGVRAGPQNKSVRRAGGHGRG